MYSILRNDLEYIVHCDTVGTIIGPLEKKHAHLPGVRETLCHYSTWSMIFNPKINKYGIQRKSFDKDDTISAGRRDMGVAGHNCYVCDAGIYRCLNFSENLQKEAKEEIGIEVTMLDTLDEFVDHFHKMDNTCIGYIFDEFLYEDRYNKERIGLGCIVTDKTDVHFTDGEVIDFQRYSSAELEIFIANNENVCSALVVAYKKTELFITKYLL